MLWHKGHDLHGVDVVILPGGFAYGDYLRAGAIARFSPIMREVRASPMAAAACWRSATDSRSPAKRACCPGALVRNGGSITTSAIDPGASRKRRTPRSPTRTRPGAVLRHADRARRGTVRRRSAGDRRTRRRRAGRVAVRRCGRRAASQEGNPNGSMHSIAGIINSRRQRPGPHATSGARRRPLLGAARWLPPVRVAGRSRGGLTWRHSCRIRVGRRANRSWCDRCSLSCWRSRTWPLAQAPAAMAIDPGMTQGPGG